MEPASPIFIRLIRAILACWLFLAGAFVSILLGGFAGLSFGAGPEQTGGMLYVLLGVTINLFVGAALAAVVFRHSSSRAAARLVFYSFTAPAFLVVLFAACLFFTQIFR